METKLTLTCEHCRKVFQRRATEYRTSRPKNIFCSHQCGSQYYTKTKGIPCFLCKKEFSIKPSAINPKGRNFCSHTCSARYTNANKTHGTRRSKLEVFLEQKLKEKYPSLEIVCNKNDVIKAELDIYFPTLKFAVELNGPCHYEPIYGPEKLATIQNNDGRKFQACIEHGIELLIIDTSKQKYVKESTCLPFLKMITDILDEKLKRAA